MTVIFTTLESTLAALRTARELARDLNAGIRILAIQVAPYPLPLGSPAVPVEFARRQLQALVSGDPATARVEIHVCRDRRRALLDALPPRSLLVMGGEKHWWPGWEKRLANWLLARGHLVMFAPR